ncbi:MAG: DUF2815 family protein [Patescibacteria group bacterium]|nr:DUF2815 family protein [Patescibacteria group bacterium]
MTTLMLKDVPIRFPAVGEPQSMGEGELAWGGKFPIDPKGPYVKVIEAAMLEVAKAKWEKDGESVLEMLKEDKKVCFERKPYKSKKNGEVYNGFDGMFTLGARTPANKPQPTVFDKYGKPVEGNAAREQLIYDGCRVNAKIEVWCQDNKYGRRINCSLLGVMFAGDGEHFGGGSAPASADDFAGLASEPEAEDVL